MEGERQAESKKDSSNNLPSEPGEAIKAFEKNLEGLENLIKLLTCDMDELFNKPDSAPNNESTVRHIRILGLLRFTILAPIFILL